MSCIRNENVLSYTMTAGAEQRAVTRRDKGILLSSLSTSSEYNVVPSSFAPSLSISWLCCSLDILIRLLLQSGEVQLWRNFHFTCRASLVDTSLSRALQWFHIVSRIRVNLDYSVLKITLTRFLKFIAFLKVFPFRSIKSYICFIQILYLLCLPSISIKVCLAGGS